MIKKVINKSGDRKKALPFGILLLIAIFTGSFFSCQPTTETATLFQKLPASQTNITFNNMIIENDIHNILNFTNLYTGAGVGIGDFNNDNQQDIFFGGNMISSALYLNKGNLIFEDITQSASVTTDRWVMGVAVVDINADGWQDIYCSVSGNASSEDRRNLLFINQKDNTFEEAAVAYGIADTAQCTQANFFDYDKDGDLDLFVIVNPTDYKLYNVNNIKRRRLNGESKSTDKLYRNNGDGTFTDVSKEAGILVEGYSLSLNVSDLNNDNWPDIYVTNDFLTNDIVYINNKNGSFTNQAASMLRHTSFASMGLDVADINNDGHPEIYVLDMFPEDNYREKMIMPGGNYDRFNYALKMGYEPQYSRNSLQLNNGDGSFSEIGQYSKVHKTDWSWSALLADYDNDGFRDLFVTNGFRRDLGNLDYINYANTDAFGSPETQKAAQLKSIKQQPGAKLLNYIFKNKDGLSFEKKTMDWGFADSTYSHGASYADLDQDGDLDLVINNVCQPAFIYENKSNEITNHHFLKIDLQGSNENLDALGSKVWVFAKGQKYFSEKTPYRGYESTVDPILHFGLGNNITVDSIHILWPNGVKHRMDATPIDTTLIFSQNNENSIVTTSNEKTPIPYFEKNNSISFLHQEDNQVDFKMQPLLPHQHSKQGPCLTSGDINGDHLEDFFIGGAAGQPGTIYLQQPDGTFLKHPFDEEQEREDTDCMLLDIDGDLDLDLYVVSGGIVYPTKKDSYQDRLYINDGLGNFVKNEKALPTMNSSGGVVVAEDYDQDGDLDLFVGGRVSPTNYPLIPASYLLANEDGIFRDVTPERLKNVGMVSTAVWTDFDTDGDQDLMLAGEFMPLTFFSNENGKISNSSNAIAASSGWWHTISPGDFDQDGDIDYLAGNLGLNSNLTASTTQPLCLYANDFDENGSIDPVLCHFVDGQEYPVASRDLLIQQIPPIKVRYTDYHSYASAALPAIFRRQEMKGVQTLRAERFENSYVENLGQGIFKLHALAPILQLAPIKKFLVEDINGDGYLDALAIGNDYSTEVVMGRYDAFNGAILWGNGQGDFEISHGSPTDFFSNKNANALIKIKGAKNTSIYIIGNNQDSLQLFTKSRPTAPSS